MMIVLVLLILLIITFTIVDCRQESLYDRGISLCAGPHIFKDALYVIDQVRTIYNSTLPIAINHCNELHNGHIDLTYGYANIFEWNLCNIDTLGNKDTQTILNMNINDAEKRLKSWFCKTAALILSPFNETMVVDLDVIFFKKPDILFDSPAYKRTHSLFFRDRIAFQAKKARKDEIRYQEVIKDFILRQSNITNITSDEAYQYSKQNGYSFFWKNVANEDSESLLDFQDSSIILLDKVNHPKTLEVLEKLLPDFKLGWGDKEIYWIAATIAQEPFSFEPFLASFYGDCTSILLHFDPTQENDPIDTVQPMYINGEWVLERVSVIGNWIEEVVSYATFVNESIVLQTLNNNHGKHCSCPIYGCRNISESSNLLVLRAQWERLTRSMSRAGPDRDCINLYKPAAHIVETMIQKYLYSPQKCKQYGCIYLPIGGGQGFNHAFDQFTENFCSPVTFDDNPINDKMKNLTSSAASPASLPYNEGDLIKFNGRSVYLLKNGTLHEFPNADTFLSMGYEWNQIKTWPQYMLYYTPLGDPLKPMRKLLRSSHKLI